MLEKPKGFIQEFKTFISRGNVIDLAVGVIIGAAFQKIISSFVNDMIMPFVGLITGGKNFNEQFIILRLPDGVKPTDVISITEAKNLGVTTLNYGSFITTVLEFLIVAMVVFLMVKAVNKLTSMRKKQEEAVPVTHKECPYCKSEIPVDASRCPNCTSQL